MSYPSGATLARFLSGCSKHSSYIEKVVAHVKDEGANLAALATMLSSMVTCGPLGMTMPYTAALALACHE